VKILKYGSGLCFVHGYSDSPEEILCFCWRANLLKSLKMYVVHAEFPGTFAHLLTAWGRVCPGVILYFNLDK
jgi:hypothetical protein